MSPVPGFDELMGAIDAPTFIVTTCHDGERAGCLIGFAGQVSIRPQHFLACLSEHNQTFRVARDAGHVAVHLVPPSGRDLAELFGGETGDDVDKFAQVTWREGPRGMPVLERCDNWFVAAIRDCLALGDHAGFLLAPVHVEHEGAAPYLGLADAMDIEPGHAP